MQNDRLLSVSFCLLHFLVFGLKKDSPHNLFISFTTSILNFSAYISENCFRVKAQPWSPEPKPTEPLLGSTYFTSIHLWSICTTIAFSFISKLFYLTYSNFAHRSVVVRVRCNNNVNVFNNTLESLIEIFAIELEFQQCAVHFVHE